MTLEDSVRALLAHWDTIDWKNAKMTGDYINDLRKALAENERVKLIRQPCKHCGALPEKRRVK